MLAYRRGAVVWRSLEVEESSDGRISRCVHDVQIILAVFWAWCRSCCVFEVLQAAVVVVVVVRFPFHRENIMHVVRASPAEILPIKKFRREDAMPFVKKLLYIHYAIEFSLKLTTISAYV